MAKRKPGTTAVATQGDCVKGMKKHAEKARLVLLDSPYNLAQSYDGYENDKRPYEEFYNWMREWMSAARECLTSDGSMWVFCPDEWVSEIDLYARLTLGLYKTRHVIWAFTFGQAATRNFTKSHCHLLWLTRKKKDYVFNAEAVAVPSARQLVYNDKRANAKGKMPDATWMLLKEQLEPYMTPDKDTWLESRICGTFKERKKHSPNQLPVPLMERIVLACSEPGDLCLDPFAGTGSLAVACVRHGRNYQGYDIGPTAVAETNARIAAEKKKIDTTR
jgi:site-specific DNA-methyltransferase (adenine-specific)